MLQKSHGNLALRFKLIRKKIPVPGGQAHEPVGEGAIEPCVDVSLITGGIRYIGTREEEETASTALMEQRPEALAITTVQAKAAGRACVSEIYNRFVVNNTHKLFIHN